MIRCRDVIDLLDRLVERDGLGEETLARMDRHLEDCPACREFVASYRAMLAGARRLPDVDLPGDVADRLVRAVLAEIGGDEPPSP